MEKTYINNSSLTISHLGTIFKEIENLIVPIIPSNVSFIVRLDGVNFSSFTKDMDKPFDIRLKNAFTNTIQKILKDYPGIVFTFHQSDEVSFLIKSRKKEGKCEIHNSGGRTQKLLSKLVSSFTYYFANELKNVGFKETEIKKNPIFDGRLFIIPDNLINKYFLRRQEDATRNSINGTGQKHLGKKEIKNKNIKEILSELIKKGIEWKELDIWKKRGIAFYKKEIELEKEVEIKGEKKTIKYWRKKIITDDTPPIFKKQFILEGDLYRLTNLLNIEENKK